MSNNKLPQTIFNSVLDSIKKLESLFPAAVKDGQLDITALREELGQFEEVGAEKYELTWAGKQAAKKLSQTDVPGRTLKYVPEDSKNADTTQNLYIEGDNLEVLKLLRQNYYGAVKMIYIDPPYNTGNDFVYRDDFAISKAESDEAEGETVDGERMVVNQKSSNRYHANWLNMMYPRLKVAKDLLSEEGVIFISIDDNEVENLKKVCNEVLGEGNFIGLIIQNKQNAKNDATDLQKNHEFILVYRKITRFDGGTKVLPSIINHLLKPRDVFEDSGEFYYINDSITTRGEGGILNARPNLGYTVYYNPKTEDKVAVCDYDISKAKTAIDYDDLYVTRKDLIAQGYVAIRPPKVRGQLGVWTWALEKFNDEKKNIIITGKPGSYTVKKRTFIPCELAKNIEGKLQYVESEEANVRSIWDYSTNNGTTALNDVMGIANVFDNAKNLDMITEFVRLVPSNDFLVFDFFSGSATTAHAVMQLNAEDGGNRRFIMVQYPEICDEKSEAAKANYINICEIGKERIRRAGEKIKSEIESGNQQIKLGEEPKKVPDIGFRVFRAADTNIRWTHEALKDGQIDLDESMMSDKEKLDFMPGYTDIDVVYEVLLRQRDIPLSAKVEKLGVGKRTYMFADAYVVCLDESVDASLVEVLAAVEPTPIKYVLRDSAFDDDISLKDETIRRLEAYIARNSGEQKKAYTVEFI